MRAHIVESVLILAWRNNFLRIPTEKLRRGVRLCLKNARRLIKDANLLIDNGSYGHALFFACTSLEETSKAFIYAYSRLEPQKIEEMKEVRKHDIKYLYYLAFRLIGSMHVYVEKARKKYKGRPLDVDDFRKFGEDLSSSIKQMLILREWSLYVDFKNKEWLSPFDVEREDTTTMIAFAENFIRYIEWLSEIFLKTPSNMLIQLKESIETQLAPSYLEELYKKKTISKRVYLEIKEGLEQAKREKNENPKDS